MLNSSAEVWREIRSPDGMGGFDSVWTLVDTVRARFSQPSAAERVVAASSGADLGQPVYLRADADVVRGDRLIRGEAAFEVLAVFQPSEPNTYLRADVRLRQAQP
jgi:head-tail adaptor